MATSISYLEALLDNPNIKAALATIRHTEGTEAADGYNYIFGSSPRNGLRFTGFATHPNNMQRHNGISSTAAGAYQILNQTYKDLCEKYGFKTFEPHDQDLMCLALFDRRGLLNAIAKGLMLQDKVMSELSCEWASLPYSKYGQPTHSIADVRKVYLENGGSIGGLA